MCVWCVYVCVCVWCVCMCVCEWCVCVCVCVCVVCLCVCVSTQTSRPVQRPAQPLIQWAPCFLPGVKRLERKVDHLPPSSAEVNNEWRYTPTPPIRLHGVERNKFMFTVWSMTPFIHFCRLWFKDTVLV